jgi:hypothetical protein
MTRSREATEKIKADMGPFSFIWEQSTRKLQIQILNDNTLQYDSLFELDSAGNMKITGTLTQSGTLTNVGRG